MRHPLLLAALLCYAAASLLHHVHNAEHLGQYPQMPAWITSGTVYTAWALTTAVGMAGFLFYRPLLVVYGLLGLYGLIHYWLAPFSAHSVAMNVTILLEVSTAALLLMLLCQRAAWR